MFLSLNIIIDTQQSMLPVVVVVVFFFHDSIISHVPNKNAFIHYFNRLPLQWRVCICFFVWASIPGMKTLSSNVFFRIVCVWQRTQTLQWWRTSYIEHRSQVTISHIRYQLKMKHNVLIFLTFMEKNRRNISKCVHCNAHLSDWEIESLIAT